MFLIRMHMYIFYLVLCIVFKYNKYMYLNNIQSMQNSDIFRHYLTYQKVLSI